LGVLTSLYIILFQVIPLFRSTKQPPPSRLQEHIQKLKPEDIEDVMDEGEVIGHADFEDGRKITTKRAFVEPGSKGLEWVNVMLGNGG